MTITFNNDKHRLVTQLRLRRRPCLKTALSLPHPLGLKPILNPRTFDLLQNPKVWRLLLEF